MKDRSGDNWFSIDCFTGAMMDNPHISQKGIASFAASLTEDEREARLYGKFSHLSGLVYKSIKHGTHIIDPFDWPVEWPVWEGIDPHNRNPNAVIWIGISPEDEKFIIDELYVPCGMDRLAELILEKRREKRYRVVQTLIDTSSEVVDASRRVMTPRRMLEISGVQTRLANKWGMKEKSIKIVQEMLLEKKMNDGSTLPELFTFNTCRRVCYEWFHYVWDEDKEVPKKKNDHMMDLIRYIATEDPKFNINTKVYRRRNSVQSYGGRSECPAQKSKKSLRLYASLARRST